MQRILITGANRGIGLELTRQFLALPARFVFAACRRTSRELDTLAQTNPDRLLILPVDVTDLASLQAAAYKVEAKFGALDVLINNAAINPDEDQQELETITSELMLTILQVNTVAPLIVTQTLLPLLRKGTNAKILFISSDMGSIGQRSYGGAHGYCASKAALNMIAKGVAADLRRDKIIVVPIDPGWVQTDMGGPHAALTPTESATGLITVLDRLTLADSGKYLAWNGQTHSW